MSSLPAGTVTFLFTDVEGSTGVLRRLGTAYGDVLVRHRELIRAAVDHHGGHEVDTQGEGFFVAFDRAKDAVAAAVAAQRAHDAEAWPEGGSLAVRMGMHTAEPELASSGYMGWVSTAQRGSAPWGTAGRSSSRARPPGSSTRTRAPASSSATSASTC